MADDINDHSTVECADHVSDFLQKKFGRKIGFTLFLFEFGDAGENVSYISNANFDDMVKTIAQWMEMVGGGVQSMDEVKAGEN